jgi:hypothetical protein
MGSWLEKEKSMDKSKQDEATLAVLVDLSDIVATQVSKNQRHTHGCLRSD